MTINTTANNNTPQQLSTTNPIQNYAQVIIILVLSSLALGSLVNFAANSLFSPSNNSISAKDERQELTQSKLREIGNSKIEKYIIGIGISFQFDKKTKIPTVTNIF
ncbi:MAG: hypothetical protein V7K32_23020 [Nostoc sp.]|uniref:hypothetical protein n=1 Tax=Nostoc sp. TaxID=1180 RepID=UPI002FFA504D